MALPKGQLQSYFGKKQIPMSIGDSNYIGDNNHTHHKVFDDFSQPSSSLHIEERKITKEELANNKQRISKELENKEPIIGKELANRKDIANNKQIDSKELADDKKLANEIGKELAKYIANNKQIDNKQIIRKELANNRFFDLVGLERNIMICVYKSCKENYRSWEEGGINESDKLSFRDMSELLLTSQNSVKETSRHLIAKGCLLLKNSKRGPGSFVQYSIPQSIYDEMIKSENNNKLEIISKEKAKELANNQTNNNKFNINKDIIINNLDVWDAVNITPVEGIGFTKNFIKQIAEEGKANPAAVQLSIYKFAYSFEKGDNDYILRVMKEGRSPAQALFGILKRGHEWSEPRYLSPEDIEKKEAKEKQDMMQRQIDEQKAEIEKLRKSADEEKFFQNFLDSDPGKVRIVLRLKPHQEIPKVADLLDYHKKFILEHKENSQQQPGEI